MKKRKKFVIFAWIISIWMIISSALVLYHVFNLQMLPMQILSMVSIIVLLIVVILLLLLHFVSKKTISRVFSSILVCLFSVVMVIGNLYLIRTNDFISSVSEQKEKVKHTVSVYALKDSKVKKLEKLDNKTKLKYMCELKLDCNSAIADAFFEGILPYNIYHETKIIISIDDNNYVLYNTEKGGINYSLIVM